MDVNFLLSALPEPYTAFRPIVDIMPVIPVLFLLVSFGMVVAVPVILATPGEWEKSQSIVWSGAGVWTALVVLTGIFNVVPA